MTYKWRKPIFIASALPADEFKSRLEELTKDKQNGGCKALTSRM